MRTLDWVVLIGALGAIVAYGLFKGRRIRNLDGYILADRDNQWPTVALAIMATQASAITFLSTPGQAYADGMRFVQFYFGLPLAMVILSITAVPIYHRLKVYTAYEYLEGRFDLKTRTLASSLFLMQRGLACALTIYAPSLILSTLLGWNIYRTNFIAGALVIASTALGGTKAVNRTNRQQLLIMLTGMLVAFLVVLASLPEDVSFGDAVYVAGKLDRLNAIDFKFDPNSRYNFWSGLIAGCFLALSYFGTDQSQVGRYLAGQTIGQSRLGLLFNGIAKVPMQFFILFVGAMVFAFYQFVTPPLIFNSVAADSVRNTAEYRQLETEHVRLAAEKQQQVRGMLAGRRGDSVAQEAAESRVRLIQKRMEELRQQAFTLIRSRNPKAEASDTNYVFLNFVIHYLPAGLLGLVLAACFAAAMSSTAAELNALSSTTVVDVYRRLLRKDASDRHYVLFSKIATVLWGAFAIVMANFATRIGGTLVELVNRIGSLFYGTILGLFLVAFYFKRVGGTAAFIGAMAGLAAVGYAATFTKVAFLWHNVIGCAAVIGTALLWSALAPKNQNRRENPQEAAGNPE